MSKSVLISINPKWCELIASGKKTVEVRKTRPKIETPFRCYIYCTKDNFKSIFQSKPYLTHGNFQVCNGKVIGEFACNKVERIIADGTCHPQYGYGDTRYNFGHLKDTQLSEQELYDYLGDPVVLTDDPCYTKAEFNGYAWHISDLVIYDKPRELSEFATVCEGLKSYQCDKCEYSYTESNESIGTYYECCCNNLKPLKRPPQSWCYVEELKE